MIANSHICIDLCEFACYNILRKEVRDMGRRENRRKQLEVRIRLITAVLALITALINLIVKLIEQLSR